MKNELLRHTLVTIDYRFKKSIKYRNVAFGDFTLGKGSRSPVEIINHMYAVLSSTTVFIQEEKIVKDEAVKLDLEGEINRFNGGIENLDKVLLEKVLDINYSKKLLQGPLSDILTHIGQLSMLSRLNDNPIEWEDFSAAVINVKDDKS